MAAAAVKAGRRRRRSGVGAGGEAAGVPSIKRRQKWRRVELSADQLLVGSAEDGFLELEELDEEEAAGYLGMQEGGAPDEGGDVEVGEAQKSKRKQKSKQKKKALKQHADAVTEEDNAAKAGDDQPPLKKKARKQTLKRHKPAVIDADVAPSPAVKKVGERVEQEQEDTKQEEEVDLPGWSALRLHSLLERAIKELGFEEPTPIQQKCIPAAALHHKDVIGAAMTGSGKTLAFGLPILQRLLEDREREERRRARIEEEEEEEEEEEDDTRDVEPELVSHEDDDAEEETAEEERSAEQTNNTEPSTSDSQDQPQGELRALILAPTRELAMQVCNHLKAVAKYSRIRIAPIVGGLSLQKQHRILKARPPVVVATPGRLWELMSQGEQHLLQLGNLAFFVLDEADRMVERGHFKELSSIIEQINSQAPAVQQSGPRRGRRHPSHRWPRQTLVFSATLLLPDDLKRKFKIRKEQNKNKKASTSDSPLDTLTNRIPFITGNKPAIIDLTSATVTADRLEEAILECLDDDKDTFLYALLKLHPTRTLVFCNAISTLRRVAALLKHLEVPSVALHANMQQRQRLKFLDRFKENEASVLVATDVAARGLDIPGVRLVVHYQLPFSAEVYVHRSGRTARAMADGCSIALVSPKDKVNYLKLCKALNRQQGLPPFPLIPAALPLARKYDKGILVWATRVALAMRVDELARKHSKTKAQDDWMTRHAKAMEIELDGDDEVTGKGKRKRGGDEDNPVALRKREQAQLKSLQQELHSLLAQPLVPPSMSKNYVARGAPSVALRQHLMEHSSRMLDLYDGTAGKSVLESDVLDALHGQKQ
eukprot:jgi/Chlat1/8481/Chrsp80S09228